MSEFDFPLLNASLNGLSAIFLAFGYYWIRRGSQATHRKFMLAAFVASILFLLCYIGYHGYNGYVLHKGPTVFREPPWFRTIYLGILLSHTLLAVLIVPLAIITLRRGLGGNFVRHRVIARWTWPVWMYVSVTGVLIYLLLYRVLPQARQPAEVRIPGQQAIAALNEEAAP